MKREIESVLQKVFGFHSFRPRQEEIAHAILEGRDVFAALPTGGGKSLCYQLPSLVLPSLTVVVSPLIALMEDQVDGARQIGIPAAYMNSSLSTEDAREVYRGIHRGHIKLLYVSPERLALDSFREALQGWSVSLFAIDEAHCISEWGHEFRKDYRNLTVLRREFPDTPIAAFTATATPRVQDDVVSSLGLANPLLVRGNFDRPEIYYRVKKKERVLPQILGFVRSHPEQAGIVYRATRKAVDDTVVALKDAGVEARPYHAGLSDETRRDNQRAFVRDEVPVIVATIAFGMGIDKSNVRWVVHGDLPRSIEAYYQETGRAGRDGENADTCLFYGPGDIRTIRYHIDRMQVTAEREQAERNLHDVLQFVNAGVCRRTQLLRHFGQDHTGNCGACDVCDGGVTQVDQTEAAQKLMSAALRTGERFGAHYLVNIVTGVTDERILSAGHHRLPTFGVGSDIPRDSWMALARDLEGARLLERRDGPKSGFVVTAAGKEVLFGRKRFTAITRGTTPSRIDRGENEGTHGTEGTANGTDGGRAIWRDDQESLFQCLRRLRRSLAGAAGVPPYVVFSDRTLKAVVRNRPETMQALLRVHGIGEKKAERYGLALITAVQDFLREGQCPDDL